MPTRSIRTRTKMALIGGIAAAAISAGGVAHADTTGSAPAGSMVIIDAQTNPTAAGDALKDYPEATDRSFTPTVDPTYGQSPWRTVTDMNGNLAPSVTGNAQTHQAITERLNVKHEDSFSWSLGGSVEQSIGFNIMDIVDAELSVKFTANHTWESSTSNSQGIWVTADPGKTVWIEANDSTATFTGNFAFNVDGVRYLVENVTITQPASSDVDVMANTSYRVMEVPSVTAGLPPNTRGGLTPIPQLPQLGTYIRDGH